MNLYALISTDPSQLKVALDPVGEENNRHIEEAASRADTIVVAWGEKHFVNQRDKKVAKLLTTKGIDLYCLEIAKSGHPRHPSRMSHNIKSLKLYSTESYLKELHEPPKIIEVKPTVKRKMLTSREGYDPKTGSDYFFHKDVMEEDF